MHEVKSFVSTKKCIQKYRSSSSYASLCVCVCVCVWGGGVGGGVGVFGGGCGCVVWVCLCVSVCVISTPASVSLCAKQLIYNNLILTISYASSK